MTVSGVKRSLKVLTREWTTYISLTKKQSSSIRKDHPPRPSIQLQEGRVEEGGKGILPRQSNYPN